MTTSTRYLLSPPPIQKFVLKHERYHHLREVREFPNSLNPRDPDSVALVQKMVGQVLDAHPEAQWFHMGADEVRYSIL